MSRYVASYCAESDCKLCTVKASNASDAEEPLGILERTFSKYCCSDCFVQFRKTPPYFSFACGVGSKTKLRPDVEESAKDLR